MGFTLLEVMIALLIFGVGLLSVAALQMVSKRANYEAVQRTTASYLALDMLERMRVNTNSLDQYVLGTMELGGGTRAVPARSCTSLAENCDSIDIARADLWEWEQRLDGVAEESDTGAATGGLVSPTACLTQITPAAGGGGTGVYEVAIAWRGVTELTNTTESDCGNDSGLYGDNNEFRRILVVRAFIDAS
jgi:type IV pilus assembly protein PilV